MAPGARTARTWANSSSGRISASATITATYDNALSRNVEARPTVAIRTPATAGPTTRPVLNMALFSPTALGTSSGPTSSTTNDCRVGMSTANTSPSRNASP